MITLQSKWQTYLEKSTCNNLALDCLQMKCNAIHNSYYENNRQGAYGSSYSLYSGWYLVFNGFDVIQFKIKTIQCKWARNQGELYFILAMPLTSNLKHELLLILSRLIIFHCNCGIVWISMSVWILILLVFNILQLVTYIT